MEKDVFSLYRERVDGDPIPAITYATVPRMKKLADVSDEAFDAVSAEVAARMNVLIDALIEGLLTPMPPPEPEPFAYGGLRKTYLDGGLGMIVTRAIDPKIFYNIP